MTIEITPMDTTATWIAVSVSSLMAILAGVAFEYLRRQKRFKWVLLLVGICIVQDIGAALMFISLHYELKANDDS